MTVKRWVLRDPIGNTTYTVPLNPREMISPYPSRALTAQTTTAVRGQVLMWEGATPPKLWSFGGTILNAAHYEALRHWTYDIKNRIEITDHYGRKMTVVMQEFEPVPKRSVGRNWRHDYTIRAYIVGGPGAPTVLDDLP